jgi:DNA repair photolyase
MEVAMNRGIGITERGDAGLDFSWSEKIDKYRFSMLITKNLNDEFIGLVKNRNNLIIHANITGYGGSKLEPNVPKPDWSVNQLGKLVDSGFSLNRIVLRVDPIFTSDKGVATSIEIMQQGINMGISRIRFSFLDTHYRHLQQRFRDAGIKIPPAKPTLSQLENLHGFIARNPNTIFESCAEGFDFDTGCVSPYDFELFDLHPDAQYINGQQRKNCKCLACKVELLNQRKRCPHQCLYCYWRD